MATRAEERVSLLPTLPESGSINNANATDIRPGIESDDSKVISNDGKNAETESERKSSEEDDEGGRRHCEDTFGRAFDWLFIILCYASGQLMLCARKQYSKCYGTGKQCSTCCFIVCFLLWVLLFLLFLCLNISSVIFDLYVVINCPFTKCGFIAISELNLTQPSSNNTSQTNNDHSYILLEHTVVTMATIAGSFSYLIMTFGVLILNYNNCHKYLKKKFMLKLLLFVVIDSIVNISLLINTKKTAKN